MHAQTLLILTTAVLATAGQLRLRDAAAQCGNGQVVSCCNSKDSGSSENSFLGGLAEGLLGGNCDQLPINVIGANGIAQAACMGNTAACCTGNYSGLINIACDPIILG